MAWWAGDDTWAAPHVAWLPSTASCVNDFGHFQAHTIEENGSCRVHAVVNAPANSARRTSAEKIERPISTLRLPAPAAIIRNSRGRCWSAIGFATTITSDTAALPPDVQAGCEMLGSDPSCRTDSAA